MIGHPWRYSKPYLVLPIFTAGVHNPANSLWNYPDQNYEHGPHGKLNQSFYARAWPQT